jgi:hypothetical protein
MERFGVEALIFGGLSLLMAVVGRFGPGSRSNFEMARKSGGTLLSAFYPLWLYGGLAAILAGGIAIAIGWLV